VSPAKTAEPIEMPIGGQTRVSPRNCTITLGRDPRGSGQFLGLSNSMKIIGSLCCGISSKSDHSIINNGTTCDAAFRQNSLTIRYHHYYNYYYCCYWPA